MQYILHPDIIFFDLSTFKLSFSIFSVSSELFRHVDYNYNYLNVLHSFKCLCQFWASFY